MPIMILCSEHNYIVAIVTVLNLLLEIVQSWICTNFAYSFQWSHCPSSGLTVLPQGDCFHKFSRCSRNNLIHKPPALAFRASSGFIHTWHQNGILLYCNKYACFLRVSNKYYSGCHHSVDRHQGIINC